MPRAAGKSGWTAPGAPPRPPSACERSPQARDARRQGDEPAQAFAGFPASHGDAHELFRLSDEPSGRCRHSRASRSNAAGKRRADFGARTGSIPAAAGASCIAQPAIATTPAVAPRQRTARGRARCARDRIRARPRTPRPSFLLTQIPWGSGGETPGGCRQRRQIQASPAAAPCALASSRSAAPRRGRAPAASRSTATSTGQGRPDSGSR